MDHTLMIHSTKSIDGGGVNGIIIIGVLINITVDSMNTVNAQHSEVKM